jgi:TolA-binding protein
MQRWPRDLLKPVALLVVVSAVPVPALLLSVVPASAIEEADRLWLVGQNAFADGLHPLARNVLARFVADYPNDPRALEATFLLGKTRLALGDAEGALALLRRVQTIDPPPPWKLDARFWEGEALFRLKRYPEARAAYDDVLRINAASPLGADALYGVAFVDLETGQRARAADELGEFLKGWPQHVLAPSATYHRARALVELKRADEAVALLEGYDKKFPDAKLQPDAAYLLGVARLRAGDTKGGIADLRAFAAAHPAHAQTPAARRLIAETLGRSGNRDELLAQYRSLMATDPPTPESYAEAANVASIAGRAPDQEAAWRKLRTTFPETKLARQASFDLANRAFQRKEWKEASVLAQSAAGDEALRPEAMLLVGEAELKLKRYQPALKAFGAVAAIDGVDPKVRYRALAGSGLAHEAQEAWRPALAAYETVAERSPDTTLRTWARARADEVKSRMGAPPPKSSPGKADPKSPSKPPAKSGAK